MGMIRAGVTRRERCGEASKSASQAFVVRKGVALRGPTSWRLRLHEGLGWLGEHDGGWHNCTVCSVGCLSAV